jgi:hypothetical protein
LTEYDGFKVLDLVEVVIVPDVEEPSRLRLDLHLTHPELRLPLLRLLFTPGADFTKTLLQPKNFKDNFSSSNLV